MTTELMKIDHIKYLEKKIVELKEEINSFEDITQKFKFKYNDLV